MAATFDRCLDAIISDTVDYYLSEPLAWDEPPHTYLERRNRDGFTVHLSGAMGHALRIGDVYLSPADLDAAAAAIAARITEA